MGDKDYLPNDAGETVRAMVRCKTCRRWWSTNGTDITACPCGGDLEGVDMVEHLKTVPRRPYDTSKDKK